MKTDQLDIINDCLAEIKTFMNEQNKMMAKLIAYDEYLRDRINKLEEEVNAK